MTSLAHPLKTHFKWLIMFTFEQLNNKGRWEYVPQWWSDSLWREDKDALTELIWQSAILWFVCGGVIGVFFLIRLAHNAHQGPIIRVQIIPYCLIKNNRHQKIEFTLFMHGIRRNESENDHKRLMYSSNHFTCHIALKPVHGGGALLYRSDRTMVGIWEHFFGSINKYPIHMS